MSALPRFIYLTSTQAALCIIRCLVGSGCIFRALRGCGDEIFFRPAWDEFQPELELWRMF